MKSGKINSRRLEQALQDLDDGALSQSDQQWLMDQMRDHPEARRAYREHMTLSAGLHHLAHQLAPSELALPETPSRWQSIQWKKTAAIAASIALLATGIIFYPKTQPHVSVHPGADTAWKYSSGGIGKDGNFLPGTRVSLDHGSLEVTMPSGTRVLLEGPAELEYHNPLLVTLASGRGWFEVAHEDTGFEVHTERLRITDVGTRFGVSSSIGRDRVQVDSGTVLLQSNFDGIPAMELKSGQAAVADLVGRPSRTPVDPALFLNKLPDKMVSIHWSFDQMAGNSFSANAVGMKAEPIRLAGFNAPPNQARLIPGAFGQALDLTAGDAYGISNYPGISGNGPRTVALWIKGFPIDRRYSEMGVRYTPSVVMWGDPNIPGASWTFRAHCVTGVIGTQWGNNGWQTSGDFHETPVLDGKWHHIASVYTGNVDEHGAVEIRHYIDGKKVHFMHSEVGNSVNTWGGGKDSAKLRIAYDGMFPSGPENVPVAVDELYIVRDALSDKQVETLYRENRIPTEN
ncbi:FecR domain-containing protein [Luteolibacter pohnpeiensis]|uniref:FecR domain-containing protein n=1 Tax=Luteolibacter pohnpeiensis TaxID=454153 RepID=A0A934S8S3_9BACT|nr:FecR domain-containing protein [Luteolibacter pohnpeiensis]MBK1881454.1 FecR domain-containing protein [Luteolibacter pohnpeiensis]